MMMLLPLAMLFFFNDTFAAIAVVLIVVDIFIDIDFVINKECRKGLALPKR